MADWENPVERYRRTTPRSGGGLDFSGFKMPNLVEIGSGLLGKIGNAIIPGIVNAGGPGTQTAVTNLAGAIGDPRQQAAYAPYRNRSTIAQGGIQQPTGAQSAYTNLVEPPTGVDPMYGAPLGRPAETYAGTDFVGQNLAQMKQQWFQERQMAIDDAVSAVNAQYAGPLDELRDRLAKYQVGDKDVQAAYGDYQADIERIGVGVEDAEGLIETDVVSAVEATYDEAEGSLGEAFAKIDSDGNPGMSQALSEELRTFETVITDSLTTDLNTMESLHGLGSDYAVALAEFAYADDKYRAESERVLIKAQFDKAIKDQQDAIRRTQAEMAQAAARARASATAQFGEFNMDMDTVRTESFMNFARGKGMSDEEASANWNVVANIMGDYGDRIVTASDFRKYANLTINTNNFKKMGLDQQLQRYIDSSPESDDPLKDARELARRENLVDNIFNRDWSAAVRGKSSASATLKTQLRAMGIRSDEMFTRMWDNPDEFDSMSENKILMDGWNIWNKTENEWDDVQQTGAKYFTDDQLKRAPSGYTFPIVGQNWGSGGGFGYVKPSGRTHQGVDIGGFRGSPIVSTADGVIEKAGWSDMSGWYVRVRDKSGNLHKYMHMDQQPNFGRGTQVTAGMQIGAVGRTGNASGGGPHLHYEIWNRAGQNVNPAPWLHQTGGWQVRDPLNWQKDY